MNKLGDLDSCCQNDCSFGLQKRSKVPHREHVIPNGNVNGKLKQAVPFTIDQLAQAMSDYLHTSDIYRRIHVNTHANIVHVHV